MKSSVDMHRLEVFCKVVELKSFTKAAEALALSQPTVSEHVRTLEQALDERLIDRLGREVLATPAGNVFYQYARNIIQLRDEALRALASFKGELSGHLELGASTIPGTYIVPKFIGKFKEHHPSVQISLNIGGSAEIVARVLEEDFEIGFIGSKLNERKLILEEIFDDDLVLAVFPDHRWASGRRIPISELEGEPFILREKGSGTRMVMHRILEENGFSPAKLNVAASLGTTEAVRQGIKARLGVSILSRTAVAEDLQQGTLVAVPMNGISFSRPIYLIHRRNRRISPVAAAFCQLIRQEVTQTG